jgi:hypothetical protein
VERRVAAEYKPPGSMRGERKPDAEEWRVFAGAIDPPRAQVVRKQSRCGLENSAAMTFRGQCGGRLALVWPNCNFGDPPSFKLCGHAELRTFRIPPNSRGYHELQLNIGKRAAALVLPEVLESSRCELVIADCVRNVLMSEIRRNGAHIVTRIGQIKARGISQQVRMYRKLDASYLADFGDEVMHGAPLHWAAG